MKKPYSFAIALAFFLAISGQSARAQYLFSDVAGTGGNGLGPYTQNFDALAGTKANFLSNSTLPGVYARFMLNGLPGEFESYARFGTQAKLAPDNGAEGPALASAVDADGTPHGAAWYHFGQVGSSDRALGGIAGTSTSPGQGYIGIRLKNNSNKVIKNLAVKYAMEQWYNSSQAQAAAVTVDYQRSASAITSLITPNGGASWVPVATLGVAAPSTSTAIAPRDGNAATNRRVLQTTIVGLNLAKGEEIMLRFGYTFNSATNGNGLSIDDVEITPETSIYYASAENTKNLNDKNSWGTDLDGKGSNPANFAADNVTYYVRGNISLLDRIKGNWTVSGTNSRVVVGTSPTEPATLYVSDQSMVRGTIDVSPGSTLQLEQNANTVTLGTLAPGSTVEYINTGTATQTLDGGSYSNLKLTGTGPKTLGGGVVVGAGLTFGTSAGVAALALGNNDLLLLKGAILAGLNGASTVIVTDGTGSLRRTVSSDGVPVLFPVGTAAAAYTPVILSQTLALSEDTYSVRVANNAYADYSAAGVGQGAAVVFQNVKKTWFVAEEVAGNSDITMRLQWNTVDAVPGFLGSAAHLNHYTGGAWDKYTATLGATAGTVAGSLAVSRPGITSFSPFGVSSRPNGSLPVELTTFGARRSGPAVACDWATATEKNSRDFLVERSTDGRTFAALGRVAAAGTSTSPREYRYLDEHPWAGRAYYRLRQTDLDGTETFSAVVAVSALNEAAAAAEIVVAPNPGTGRFGLFTADGQPVAGPVVVFNALGAVVLRQPLADPAGSAFDLSREPAGLYLVQVQTAAGLRTLRLLKQ